MFKLRWPDWARDDDEDVDIEAPAFVERRADMRQPVFREAVLTLEGYYRVRAVISDVSAGGVCIAYATRIDLPSRIVVSSPTLKLDCWARVVWQRDGVAGLELQEEARSRR